MNVSMPIKQLKHKQIAELVKSALEFYGGKAHLDQITKKVLQLNPKIFENSKTIEAEIRDIIQKYSSDSKKFKYEDLFQSVYGVSASKGVWELRDYPKEDLEVNNSDYASSFKEITSIVREISVRLVQKDFRTRLIQKYQATCPLTGISVPSFLIASHIKPWSKSTNIERQDINNGILLSAHIDKLFDSGDISFDDKGKILYKNDVIRNLVIDNFRLKYDKLEVNEHMRNYLKWHRNHFNFI